MYISRVKACVGACLLFLLWGCSDVIPYRDNTLEQVFCINIPVSELSCYSSAYTVSQLLSKECLNLRVKEEADNRSREIWREIHKKLGLTSPYIPIVAYGSLMHPISAKKTLQEYHRHAVWVHDYIRIFDFDLEAIGKVLSEAGGDDIENRGVLNLKQETGSSCNAFVLAMGEEDFVACRNRECIYDLVPVVVSDYSSDSCKRSVAFAWITNNHVRSKKVLPIKGYYSMVWAAVSSDSVKECYGERFSEDYLRTTFLANGESITTIHKEYQY
ncbi:gamma-glutamylcyclotransferase [Chlamydia vaughanii]|uniref:gamma-glutamylcyclotransferase n=1 Tax=Chlamydia vaughanii TaxID=3112552 RepID=UPI0032B1D3B2